MRTQKSFPLEALTILFPTEQVTHLGMRGVLRQRPTVL